MSETKTIRAVLISLLVLSAAGYAPAFAQTPSSTLADKIKNATRMDGFLPIHWDEAAGKIYLELSRFDAPAIASDHRTAPVNSLGYLRVMFAVDDIDDTLGRLAKRGARVVDEVVDYEGIYRLCYIRGPEGILIGLAQELRPQVPR